MLKTEIKRIEQTKGVKSQLSGKGAELNVKGNYIGDVDMSKMSSDMAKLKNQVKCLQIELE